MSKSTSSDPILIDKDPLETLLSRLDKGWFHYIVFISITFAYFSYGFIITTQTILPQIFSDYWGIDTFQADFLGGSFTAGFTIGTLAAGTEDIFGRIVFVRWGIVCTFIGGTFGAVMPEFYSFCIFPFIAGMGVGLYEVSAVTYCTEINKIEYRARFFIYLNFTYFAGAVVSVALAFALVPGLTASNWRWLVAIGGIPALFGAILSFTHLTESPRHLLAHKRYDEVEQVLNKMLRMNGKEEMSPEEFDAIKNQKIQDGLPLKEGLKIIYNKQNFRFTMQVTFNWFVFGVELLGVLFLAPLAFSSGGGNPLIYILII